MPQLTPAARSLNRRQTRTCAEAFGRGWAECGAGCFNYGIGQTCCSNGGEFNGPFSSLLVGVVALTLFTFGSLWAPVFSYETDVCLLSYLEYCDAGYYCIAGGRCCPNVGYIPASLASTLHKLRSSDHLHLLFCYYSQSIILFLPTHHLAIISVFRHCVTVVTKKRWAIESVTDPNILGAAPQDSEFCFSFRTLGER